MDHTWPYQYLSCFGFGPALYPQVKYVGTAKVSLQVSLRVIRLVDVNFNLYVIPEAPKVVHGPVALPQGIGMADGFSYVFLG